MYDIFFYHDVKDDIIKCDSIGIPMLHERLDMPLGCTWGDIAATDSYIIFYERVMKNIVGHKEWIKYCHQLYWHNKGSLDAIVEKALTDENIFINDIHGFIKDFSYYLNRPKKAC